MIPKVSAYIDSYHPKEDFTCSVYIRVTFNRERKYYPTGISVTKEDFDRAMTAKRKRETDTILLNRINAFLSKAISIVGKLPVFTFNQFEELYYSNRDAVDSVSEGFERYIKKLKSEGRVSTASSYECAKNSINNFKTGLRFADITPAMLRTYENEMLKQGLSITTIGIYLRSLRTIFNIANVDRSLYPFGANKGKYSIPSGRNIKKALAPRDIEKIYKHIPPPGSSQERAKDYWIFLYLCNGINVKDFCLLKYKNLNDNIITYIREKTIRTRREQVPTVISVKQEAKKIISKWGQPADTPDTYIFPHLNKDMTPERIREVVQQVTKNINTNMKKIAKELEISNPVTTYSCRHSFATMLKNAGISTEYISEALAHNNIQTTKSYLASFETDKIHSETEALLKFN